MFKSLSMFSQKTEIEDLLMSMDNNFSKLEDLGSFAEKNIYIKEHKILKKWCIILITIYVSTTFAIILPPFMKEGEVLPYECYRPPWMNYEALLIMQNLIGVLSTLFCLLPVDIFFMTIITLAYIEFKLLNERLLHIFECENLTEIQINVSRSVEYHSYLLDFVKRMKIIFSEILLIYFIIISLTICIQMYRASSTERDLEVISAAIAQSAFALYGFMICYCFPAQDLIDEAFNICNKIYSSTWYNCSKHSKSLVPIMRMGQRQIHITAGGIVNINLETGLDTIKSTISYCMFLRTMDGQH